MNKPSEPFGSTTACPKRFFLTSKPSGNVCVPTLTPKILLEIE